MSTLEGRRGAVRPPCASIVIPAYRNPRLADCLDALRTIADDGVRFDIHVVLNDASPEVADIARRHAPAVSVWPAPGNLGVGLGCNFGFNRAEGEFLVQLQDDAIVEPGWLHHLVRRARDTPDAGAVGSLVLDPAGRVVEAGGFVWNDGNPGRCLDIGSVDPDDYRASRTVDYHGSDGLLIRREAWQSVGGFDPAFHPVYHGDIDFCHRLRARGWRVLVEPLSRVTHQKNASTTTLYREFLGARHRTIFAERHAAMLATHGAPSTVAADIEREIQRARRAEAQAPPTPPTSSELAELERHSTFTPEDVLRMERDARAAYAEWLEARLAATVAHYDETAADGVHTAQELERSVRNATALTAELRRAHDDYRELEEWARMLEHTAAGAAVPAQAAHRWTSERIRQRIRRVRRPGDQR